MYLKISRCLPFVLLFMLAALVAQAQKELIVGQWLNEDKDAEIRIFEATNGKYYGKIIWLKEPNRNGKPKTDIHNPKAANRNHPIIDMQILKGFKKISNVLFEDGTIYDPKNGKTYSCKITVKDENTLHIRGFVGISMLGRTTVWTRSK